MNKENFAEPIEKHGLSNTSSLVNEGDIHNESSEEGEKVFQHDEEITRKSGWKHQSSHLLDNLVSPRESAMHTRSKTRNLV